MVTGGSQVRVYAPQKSMKNKTAQVASWNMPAYICVQESRSVMMSVGEDANPLVLTDHVANALGIRDGDSVEFTIVGCSKRFSLPVTVRQHLISDFIINPLMTNIDFDFQTYTQTADGETIGFRNGETIDLFKQHMFAGLSISTPFGHAVLTFDGASRNNPDGPSGCGFAIRRGELLFIRGYRYFGKGTSNEMEYRGLLEGLHWAQRLKLASLQICGDSELVIRQLMGEYSVQSNNLRPLYQKAKDTIDRESFPSCTFAQIPREANVLADSLANQAIDLQENVVACNWANVNAQCRRTPWG